MILATQRAIGDSFFTTSLRDRPGEDERWLNERGVWLHYRRLEEREPLRPEGMELEWFKEMLLEMLAQEPTVYRRRARVPSITPFRQSRCLPTRRNAGVPQWRRITRGGAPPSGAVTRGGV